MEINPISSEHREVEPQGKSRTPPIQGIHPSGSTAKIPAPYLTMLLLLLLTSMEGYAIFGIPITWLGRMLFIAYSVFLRTRCSIRPPRELFGFIGLGLWLGVVTLCASVDADYARLLPNHSSTPYVPFVLLRFLHLMAFIAAVYVAYCLLSVGAESELARAVVYAGVIVSIWSLYAYVAVRLGLPVAASNRLGTDGMESTGRFTYEFHRAAGPFSEPSHLGEWLVLPLFIALGMRKWLLTGLLIGCVTLLTGSLMTIAGSLVGVLLSLFLSNPISKSCRHFTARLVAVVGLSLACFNVIAFTYSGFSADLISTLSDRLTPMFFEYGLMSSNRDYIWDYVSDQPLPLFGDGLGNSNLVLSAGLGTDVVASFLSLYFNMLFSGGFVALGCLALMLFWPPLKLVLLRRCGEVGVTPMLAGYIAWLVMFSVGAEELSPMFAIAFAFIALRWRPGTLPSPSQVQR